YLSHATNIRRRNGWVEMANLISHRRLERHWRHARPENQKRGAAQPWHRLRDDLSPWKVNVEGRLHLELLLFHIANHTDHLNRPGITVRGVHQESLAKRRAVIEEFARERRTDQCDRRTIRVIFFGEIAPSWQRNAHRRNVSRSDNPIICSGSIL